MIVKKLNSLIILCLVVSRLVVIVGGEADNDRSYYYWFELRDPNDMNVLQVVQLSSYWTTSFFGDCFVPLSREQFLVGILPQKTLFIINADGQVEATIPYDLCDFSAAAALINS
ncbi:unnamed protein product [Didymodactylos carnosus]|uniref:Uncharacterized protein n=1 Tax=Didymodactylos carnosus TaxID=1234261 RepID=A0A815QMU1_9BILA|nr:unnamed protein product [Didymodactylos carnosus]CAF1464194.1 unnamed protein product [Didymodactylos carnosus]CAF3738698.1 unnamed protein product [Didymodactylos carnosus]CAF4333734.1 unnamed protein product [Didymodactylos carnosus]